MMDNTEVRVCKNKKCQKVLPIDYKHKYCEACMNQHVDTAKKCFKGFVAGAASIVTMIVVAGKNNSNK